MTSLYRGREKFSYEQLVFVAQTILTGALDLIASGLPDCIDYAERADDLLMVYERSALEAAGMGLGVFYAQLTGDGLSVYDAFVCADHFDEACERLVADAWSGEGKAVKEKLASFEPGTTFSRTDLYPDYPDTRKHAEAFVKSLFGEYLAK